MTQRLTKDLRRQIVNAIMEDVPRVDYAEKAKKQALKLAVASLPPAAKRLWEDPSSRGLLKTNGFYVHSKKDGRSYCVLSVSLPGYESLHDAIRKDLIFAEACAAQDTAEDERMRLTTKLRSNLNACVNLKAFVERFPELAKYVPEDAEAPINLPATTELLDTLRAAGLKLAA